MRTSFGGFRILCAISVLLSCGEPTSPRTEGTATRNLGIECFYGVTSGGQRLPLSQIVHELRATDRGDVVDVAVIFNREFVDNTYGVNSIGWESREHTFKDLTGSDHVELALINGAGEESFRAKIDYLTASDDAASGFRSLGAGGGDGKMVAGAAGDIVAFGSSLEDNFNRYGYVLLEDSPATDSTYAPNQQFPEWNFWVEYRVSVLSTAFGASRFAHPTMQFVHASPSKFGTNSVVVEEGDCPDENNPFPECERTSPESECYDPETNGGSPDPSQGGDSDGDGVPDLVDDDDDGDGVLDPIDSDRNGDGIPDDADGDGIPNVTDSDDDNDGVLDDIDGDDDGDGVPDEMDPDAVPDPVGGSECTTDEECGGSGMCVGGYCVDV